MEFPFSCSTWHLMHLQPSLVSYWVEHLKRNSISTPVHVLFSVCFTQSMLHFVMCVKGWRGGGGEGEERGKKFGKFLDNTYWKQYVPSNEKYPLIVTSITTLYLNLGYPT